MTRATASLGALGAALLLAGGCNGTPPSPVPVVEPLDDASTLAVVSSRTDVEGVYAVIECAYDGPDRSGAFDAVVYWRAPGRLRVSAFKDLVLATRGVFDLCLGAERYAVEVLGEDDEPLVERGALEDFPREQERFAGFYWAREALFLAGAIADEARVVERTADRVVLAGRVRSGAAVRWIADPDTLAIREGLVTAGEREVRIAYAGFFAAGGGVFLPGEVTFSDPAAGTRMVMRVDEHELDPPPDPFVFDPDTVGGP